MSIPEQRFIEVTQRLNEISDGEWRIVIKKCKDHIRLRLKQKCATGAHSEKNLGMSAFDFYFGTALTKLYEGVWDWKFEKFSILEQFIRIIDSMISEVVRKYKVHHSHDTEASSQKFFEIDYHDIESSFYALSDPDQSEPLDEPDDYYNEMLDTVTAAIEGDDELEDYLFCVMEGMNADEISDKLNWPKRKVYKTTEKVQRRVKSYIKSTTNGN